MSVSDVLLDAEFKYVSRNSYHPHLSLSDSDSSAEDVGQTNKNVDCDPTFAEVHSSNEPHLLTQGGLHNIIYNFNLSNKESELLGSRLKGSSAPEP